jgi:hypothetical protein
MMFANSSLLREHPYVSQALLMVALLIRQSYQCLASLLRRTLRSSPASTQLPALCAEDYPAIILLWLLGLLSLLSQARRPSAVHVKLE